MRGVTLKQLHAIIGGRLRLAARAPLAGESTPVEQITTDSRQVQAGHVFWALSGNSQDGADFAADAFSRGAAGVVASRYVQPTAGRWSLEIDNPQAALWQLADWNRRRSLARVVAVTGSVGKTTTRQMIRAVLERRLTGSSSPKNYNNHVGLPLAMLAIEPGHDYAVLELAASGGGEIDRLSALCRPQIGVLTRIGDAHLGGFGSLDAVASAKAEMLSRLGADGWAVLCGDDARLRRLAGSTRAKIVWFGRSLENDLVATHVESRHGMLRFRVGGVRMSVPAWGRHHLTCAMAAVAVGRIFGLEDATIAHGLAQFQPAPMRCQVKRIGGATIIDDSYNASPVAMKAALELLRDFDAPGRRIVVCGDMRELGPQSESLHRQLGDQVVTLCGADLLVACGEHAQEVVAGAQAAGMPKHRTQACRDLSEVAAGAVRELAPGDVMLVKGSRAMAMDQLVRSLESAHA